MSRHQKPKVRKQPKSSKGLNFRRRRRSLDFDLIKIVLRHALEIVLVIFLGWFTVSSFFLHVENPGSSMDQTIKNGTVCLVNRLKYKISDPKAGDLIAYLPDNNLNNKYSIKRVIGLPGDTVQIKNGSVYINDQLYSDLNGVDSMTDPGLAENPILLGEDEYFVLGDNRNNSEDSRYASVGNITKDEIYGEIWWKISKDDFGWVY